MSRTPVTASAEVRMKLAIVVQRYGTEIGGGAELHARYIAERLSSRFEVRVLTTCARDYLTWRNEFSPGHEKINGVRVERFPVSRERDVRDFGIERKYVDMFERLASESEPSRMEPSPGRYARRRTTVPAATELLANLPSGPVTASETSSGATA